MTLSNSAFLLIVVLQLPAKLDGEDISCYPYIGFGMCGKNTPTNTPIFISKTSAVGLQSMVFEIVSNSGISFYSINGLDRRVTTLNATLSS